MFPSMAVNIVAGRVILITSVVNGLLSLGDSKLNDFNE